MINKYVVYNITTDKFLQTRSGLHWCDEPSTRFNSLPEAVEKIATTAACLIHDAFIMQDRGLDQHAVTVLKEVRDDCVFVPVTTTLGWLRELDYTNTIDCFIWFSDSSDAEKMESIGIDPYGGKIKSVAKGGGR